MIELKEQYNHNNTKTYKELKDYFTLEINYNKRKIKRKITCKKEKNNYEFNNIEDEGFKKLLEEFKDYRVWLLFAKNDNNENVLNEEDPWICLQVAQSKNELKQEIQEDLGFIISPKVEKVVKRKDSQFYKDVCPTPVENMGYRELLYKEIGNDYSEFKICILNVDKYLGLNISKYENNDVKNIVEICKNQYAEAKIAYQTLAVYWNAYKSGIDGQTISYIVAHKDS